MPDANRTLVISPDGAILPELINLLLLTYRGRPLGDVRTFAPNVLHFETTLNGARINPRTVIDDDDILATDGTVIGGSLTKSIALSLPPALGTGQFLYFQKSDESEFSITVSPNGSDVINDSTGVVLSNQYDDLTIRDSKPGLWSRQLTSRTQLQVRSVSSDDDVSPSDFGFLADATDNPFSLLLPPATGTARSLLFVKDDDTDNPLTIQAQDGEKINRSISVNLVGQDSDCLLFDMGIGYWHNFGLQDALILPDDPPSVPALDADAASLFDVATKVNALITLLDNYGLSQ